MRQGDCFLGTIGLGSWGVPLILSCYARSELSRDSPERLAVNRGELTKKRAFEL